MAQPFEGLQIGMPFAVHADDFADAQCPFPSLSEFDAVVEEHGSVPCAEGHGEADGLVDVVAADEQIVEPELAAQVLRAWWLGQDAEPVQAALQHRDGIVSQSPQGLVELPFRWREAFWGAGVQQVEGQRVVGTELK